MLFTCASDVREFFVHNNPRDYYCVLNGNIIDFEELSDSCAVHIHEKLRGGKGGFGSMLRAIGSQIEKTTNHEMCRDLTGRRMRDVNAEKKLREWYASASQRDKEKVEHYLDRRKRRRELLEKGPIPSHKFNDPKYQKQKEKISDELQKSIECAKRGKLWLEKYDEIELTSSDESINEPLGELTKVEEVTDCQSEVKELKKEEEVEEVVKPEVVEKAEKPKPVPLPDPLTDEEIKQLDSVNDFEALGLEMLKSCLMSKGLKCSGSLQERASRLHQVKDMTPDQYPKKLKAKTK